MMNMGANIRMKMEKKPWSWPIRAMMNQISNPIIIAAHMMFIILIASSHAFNYIYQYYMVLP